MQFEKQELKPCMQQLIGSRLRKEYNSALCCFLNAYTECIMKNAGLDELQTGIKIERRNINNLRYVDSTQMAESEKELKSLFVGSRYKREKADHRKGMGKHYQSC